VPRRVSLPGADELFRTTGGASLQAPQQRQRNGGEAQQPAQGDARLRPVPDGESETEPYPGGPGDPGAARNGSAEEHSGRETAPGPRRPFNGERPGTMQSATATAPVATATVAAQAPAAPGAQAPSQKPPPITATPQPPAPARRKSQRQNRRPSGRERHDEKITVYVSAEELMDLEHARLVLRGEHGLAIDRGRIVREAVAVVLADLESRGDASILVRRLRGR
jgi:hypothetical protein